MPLRGGFALVNIAVGAGIVAVMFAAVAHGSGAVDSARTARLIDDVQTLRSAVETWAKARGKTSYGGLSVGALNASNVLTKAMLTNPWGGTVELSLRTSDSYWITLGGLPRSARDAVDRHYQTQALATRWNGQEFCIAFQ